MSDFEMITLMLMFISVIVGLLIEYITFCPANKVSSKAEFMLENPASYVSARFSSYKKITA